MLAYLLRRPFEALPPWQQEAVRVFLLKQPDVVLLEQVLLWMWK